MLAYGAVFFGYVERLARNDARMRRYAELRAHRFPSGIWYWSSGMFSGKPAPRTHQEKTEYWLNQDRRKLKWLRPFAVLWFGLTLAGIVVGVLGA